MSSKPVKTGRLAWDGRPGPEYEYEVKKREPLVLGEVYIMRHKVRGGGTYFERVLLQDRREKGNLSIVQYEITVGIYKGNELVGDKQKQVVIEVPSNQLFVIGDDWDTLPHVFNTSMTSCLGVTEDPRAIASFAARRRGLQYRDGVVDTGRPTVDELAAQGQQTLT